MREPDLALALVGFGNVARRFLKLLDEAADRLDFQWRLVAVATRHHGSVVDPDGIDARRAAATVEASQSLDRLDPAPRERSGIDVIRQVTDALAEEATEGQLVVVETTVLDIDGGEPATGHVRASLEGLAHVVTANKGPVAFAYDDLETLAESVDRVFFFEGTVMDGVPVFNLVRETMPGVIVEGFRGVVNTTCQYALSEMERGLTMDDAIVEMQSQGITETDPSLDIDAWDAAAKTSALVNVLMGGGITPHAVTRMGIRDVSPERSGFRGGSRAADPTRGVRGAAGGRARRARGAGTARSERSARQPREIRKRALPPDRSAGRGRNCATHELAAADRLRATERSDPHQPPASGAIRTTLPASGSRTEFPHGVPARGSAHLGSPWFL